MHLACPGSYGLAASHKDHLISLCKNCPFLEGWPASWGGWWRWTHPQSHWEWAWLGPVYFLPLEMEIWWARRQPREEQKNHSSGCIFLTVEKQFEARQGKRWMPTVSRKNMEKICRKPARLNVAWLPGRESLSERPPPSYVPHFPQYFCGTVKNILERDNGSISKPES